jgi:hypothetical protein
MSESVVEQSISQEEKEVKKDEYFPKGQGQNATLIQEFSGPGCRPYMFFKPGLRVGIPHH